MQPWLVADFPVAEILASGPRCVPFERQRITTWLSPEPSCPRQLERFLHGLRCVVGSAAEEVCVREEPPMPGAGRDATDGVKMWRMARPFAGSRLHSSWVSQRSRPCGSFSSRMRHAAARRGRQVEEQGARRRGNSRTEHRTPSRRPTSTTSTSDTLRHTFASWAVMRGVTLKELQELLGHASLAMTMRCAHLAPEHLRTAVSRLEGLACSQPASDSAQASAQEPVETVGASQKSLK
jgi:hypothetical protein